MDAAQSLSQESYQDLAEMLLPTPVLPAFFARSVIPQGYIRKHSTP
jgi:hypothetical protein